MVTDSDSTENQQDDASAASVDDSANKKHQSLIYLENGKSRAKKTRKKTFSKNTFSKTTTRMIPVRVQKLVSSITMKTIVGLLLLSLVCLLRL
jgi:hypothetical protein